MMTTPTHADGQNDAKWDPGELRRSAPGPKSDEHRTMAMLAWALLLAGVVAFLPGLAAGIVAYVKRDGAPALWRGHYDRIIRMFWIWLILVMIGTPLVLILVGYAVLAVAAIWTAVVGVIGLIRAIENKPA